MANTKSKVTVTIDNEVNEKLEEIMALTLAPKSAQINQILKDWYSGSVEYHVDIKDAIKEAVLEIRLESEKLSSNVENNKGEIPRISNI